MKDLTLQIAGMTCGECVSRVQTALEETRGVRSATVSLEASEARLAVDDALDASDVLNVVRAEGFEASVGT